MPTHRQSGLGIFPPCSTPPAFLASARPTRFIRSALHTQARIPQASAEASLDHDRRVTDEWKRAATEVVFSPPTQDKDRNLAPSPLIAGVPVKDISLPEYPRYRDLIF